jgi:hypothetical protein
MNACGDNNLFQAHKLHQSKTPVEFADNFLKHTNKGFIEHVYSVINPGAIIDVLLVGSLANGVGTKYSDIDVYVISTIEKYQLSREQHPRDLITFENPGGGLLLAQVIAPIAGLEMDIHVIDVNRLMAIYASLTRGNIHLSQLDIKMLAALTTPWSFINKSQEYLFSDDLKESFTIFCTTRAFVFAIQEYQDAETAMNSDSYLAVHLSRHVIEWLVGSLLAYRGICFLGVKWIKKVRKYCKQLEVDGEVELYALLDDCINILYGKNMMTAEDIHSALNNTVKLMTRARSYIEIDPLFAASFAGCRQISAYEIGSIRRENYQCLN